MTEAPATPKPSNHRSERRVRVRLAVGVRGTDRNGARFEEKTFSEDLCRGGMAFVLSRPMEPGVDLEIPFVAPVSFGQEEQTEFVTRGQVRHVQAVESGSVVGVVFVGPRLHRLFLSESAVL